MSRRESSVPLHRRERWEEIGDTVAFGGMVLVMILGMAYHGLPGLAGRGVTWGLCALLGCWVLARFAAGRWTELASRTEKLAVLAAVLPLGWLLVQLVPLPRGLVEAISPWQAGMAARATAAGISLPDHLPIAIRPERAADTLAQGVAYACFFLAALQLAGSRRGAWQLALVVSLVGVGEGLGGLLQAAGTDRSHGSLVNPNHFAAQALMGLTVATGYVLAKSEGGRSRAAGAMMLPAGVICLGLLGWMLSLSRGSLFLGGAVTAAWFLRRRVRGFSGPAATLALSFGLLVVVWVVSGDFSNSRIAALRDQSGDRRQYVASMLRAGMESPWVGFGGRAAEPLLLEYASFATEKTPIFAHNDLIQAPVEMGMFGFVPWAVILVLGLMAHRREWAIDVGELGGARLVLRSAAGTACVAALAHAAVDFHLRIPAVGFMFLACLALRLGRGSNWPLNEVHG